MYSDEITPKRIALLGAGIAVLIIGFIAIRLISASFTTIQAGQKGVVLNWGKIEDQVLDEGIFWRTPFKQQVKKVDVQVQKEQVDSAAASKDLQDVGATIALNYHLDSSKVHLLWQSVGADYKVRLIDPAIQEAVKAATAQYTAEELITKRAVVRDEIKRVLSERLMADHIIVNDVSIVNFNFSRSFNEAIEAKVTAEQNALAAKNKLEQVKFEAAQQIEKAKAEAETIRISAAAITQQGGAEYVKLKAVEKWSGLLPVTMVPGSALPFLDIK